MSWLALAAATGPLACAGGEAVDARAPRAPAGAGPRIVWDLGARPFPEIPLPNDVATYADPTSPTGLRINASMIAPTSFERTLRQQFDQMDGWGTFMPISLSVGPGNALDLDELQRRHAADYDFRDDAVYLVDLETGLPVPLDVGNGNFPLTLARPEGWFPNDPRAGGSNLLLATVDEDTNGDGVLQPEEDTNFDGHLQRAAVHPRGARPEDALTTHWEPETGTLMLRPLVPLAERRRYAVVVTDRLRGPGGPVRSPFPTVAHPAQLDQLAPLARHLADPELARRFYGALAWQPAPNAPPSAGGRVAFAWTFTTQTTVSDLFDVHAGLHGRGPFAALARTTPDFRLERLHGGNGCNGALPPNVSILEGARLQEALRAFVATAGMQGAQADALVESYRWVDYMAMARVRTPYLAGDPRAPDPDAHWDINARTGQLHHVGEDTVQLWIFVPRAQPGGAQPPFPVAFNAHGYASGALQSIAFAGYFARFGIATVAANAPAHGFPLGNSLAAAVRTLLNGQCLGPFGAALVAGRARDVNGDGEPDSGGDFLSARVFHARDMVRQTALDYMQIVRAITDPAFGRPGGVDYNNDGRPDAPGDLNGDGTPDFGVDASGRPTPLYIWGESLGGITSMVLGALDPAITAVAPVSGGAGLSDVTSRTTVPGVGAAVLTPMLGPIVVAVPAEQRGPQRERTRTACRPGELSLRWVVPDGYRVGELEWACSALGAPGGSFAPGDDVVVWNVGTGAERCARVPQDGRLFLPVAADAGDPLELKVYRGHVVTDYGTCARPADAPVRTTIDRFAVGEGDCDETCGHVPPVLAAGAQVRRYRRGDRLVAPASGLGLRRQTAALRRFIQLSQAAIDPADPVNFAPLFFLAPRTPNPHPLLTFTTTGDTDVPVSTGHAFARAAGLVPFIAAPTGSPLDEYVAPESLLGRYGRTPNALLIDTYVIEGLSRLERHPVAGGRHYLFDPDDLDEGRQGYGEAALSPPLRLVRGARPIRATPGLTDPAAAAAEVAALWRPARGEPLASFFSAYIRPEGVHTFFPSNPDESWDNGAYFTNLVARFFQSGGTDVVFYTDPSGHQCLEDSSCGFIPRP